MDEAFRLLWKRYRTWAITSRRSRATQDAWKWRVLLLTLGGTALATLSPFIPSPGGPWPARIAAYAGAAALALATYLGKELLDAKQGERWTRARLAAEAFKSEAFRYVAQAPPYDASDREAKLKTRLTQLNDLTKGNVPLDVSDDESKKGMPETFWSAEDYKKKRLMDQIVFYRDSAARHMRSMTKGRFISLTLGGLAVLLGAVIGAVTGGPAREGTLTAAILGIVTTAGAAIGAYIQASHYEATALKYRETADALEEKSLLFTAGLSAENQQLIAEVEGIMQAENAVWLAELTTKK